ncbi:MAG: hypothetical protein RL173_3801, partial [Fibrobacterota bacterium]
MTILRNFMIPALAAIGTGSAASGP